MLSSPYRSNILCKCVIIYEFFFLHQLNKDTYKGIIGGIPQVKSHRSQLIEEVALSSLK